MFRIILNEGTGSYFYWPIHLTTVADGGPLLLFVEVSSGVGRPTKRLERAYGADAWWSVVHVEEWHLNGEPWEASYDLARV